MRPWNMFLIHWLSYFCVQIINKYGMYLRLPEKETGFFQDCQYCSIKKVTNKVDNSKILLFSVILF